jgi:glycosyltransferase involved in cell wall biosynthesis
MRMTGIRLAADSGHAKRPRAAASRRPLVSVLVAVANGERYLRIALESALRQSLADLELLVVDDGSDDATPAILGAIDDARLRVLRNEQRSGLATSLNRALDEARGRFVARLDADDVAMPRRLERQLAAVDSSPNLGVVGSAVLELDRAGRPGAVHAMPSSPTEVSWAALFSSPFYHPSVLVDRGLLERHSLRYDPTYLESEDYDLWTRLLAHADGDNLPEPLLLYRVHAGQASSRRRDLQRDFQREIALREIASVAPALDAERAELAWRVGAGERIDGDCVDAADAFVELLEAFESRDASPGARRAAARRLVRLALRADGCERRHLFGLAARLDPTAPVHALARSTSRRRAARVVGRQAEAWLEELGTPGAKPLRVAAVFPEPTPYRAPLLDRVAELPEIDLTVVYAARTVAGRTWRVEPRHRAHFLRGVGVPGAERVLHHAYPVTPGIARALERALPDVVVVSGWSTFASQAAIAWCRVRDVPYVLVVESHDEGPRAGWRRRVKGTVVPRVVGGASGVLVTGTLARRSMIARGAPPERVRVFANTIDVDEFGRKADGLATQREELRQALGAGPDDVVVLSVGRLATEKGLDVLVHAVAEAGDPRLLLVIAGDGPERERLEDLARVRGVRAVFEGDLDWGRIVETYLAADVFALLSEREPWAVVVNEAAACGLPLVLSDRVGAAHDLLLDGENGVRVAAGDVDAAAAALRLLASDDELRRAYGARSRELAQDWGYGPSVEGFLAAVREAVSDSGRRD